MAATENSDQLMNKKGQWNEDEDRVLMEYVRVHGCGRWNRIGKITGLKRCGKSCRLRWLNYLNPKIKHGHFTEDEDDLIIRLHKLLGNRWSLIAGRVPGRTDNQVKNHWNTNLKKKAGSVLKGSSNKPSMKRESPIGLASDNKRPKNGENGLGMFENEGPSNGDDAIMNLSKDTEAPIRFPSDDDLIQFDVPDFVDLFDFTNFDYCSWL